MGLVVEKTTGARLDMERFLMRLFFKIIFLAILCLCLAGFSWAQPDAFSQSEDEKFVISEQMTPSDENQFPPSGLKTEPEKEASLPSEQKIPTEKKKEPLTRGQKTLLLNVGSMAGICIYGLTKWEYGESNFHFYNEGWFGRETKDGGADKFGHFWSNYALSHLYSYIYRKWGYTDREANLYGALSSLGANLFMEIADGFSPSQGFAREDMIMNLLGCGAGYVWGKYPSLASKIDFRIEVTPEFTFHDLWVVNNYDRHRFLIALKAEGFNFIKNPYLRYLEVHVGYYARGYEDYEQGGPDHRRRNLYVGIGFNASKLLQKFVDTRVLDYIQIPYTSLREDFPLD